MKEFQPGSHYTLERFDGYWGPQPYFKTIQILVTPEISNQKLQLDSGAFDIVTEGFAIADVLDYQKNPDFDVKTAVGASQLVAYFNYSGGMFQDKALRQAMMSALDRKAIVATAWSGLTSVSENFWPEDMFPAGLAPFSTDVNLEPLKAKVAGLPNKKLDIAWVTSYGAPAQQVAELIQTQLAPAGLEATVRAMPSAEQFDLCNQPPNKRPDLMVAGLGGDALHLDTAIRIYLRTGEKPLNFYGYSSPALDQAMDDAVERPTTDEMNQAYLAITKTIEDEALWLPFAATPNMLIMHKGITGLEVDPYLPEIFAPGKIKRT